jgi:hypothetical protein
MEHKVYEELQIDDNDTIRNLNKIIDAIGYDTTKVVNKLFKPDCTEEYALSRVSEESLNEIMQKDRPVATLDCSLYKFENVKFDFFTKRIAQHVKDRGVKEIGLSGRIWYPVCGYMGWHTNSDNKGLRIYSTFSKEAGKSFFRYRDPHTGEIVTSWDKQGWNFRLFHISDKPLWHCVFSMTDRFSIGYALKI